MSPRTEERPLSILPRRIRAAANARRGFVPFAVDAAISLGVAPRALLEPPRSAGFGLTHDEVLRERAARRTFWAALANPAGTWCMSTTEIAAATGADKGYIAAELRAVAEGT